uniref:Uncharacterized protein n=1 Tax=Alexandrium andersonii TaxID=327968 RepID=A0A7S2J9D1_9DINO
MKDLGEELKSLRRVISEDLLRGWGEVSQKSESHRFLFSAAKEDLLATAYRESGAARQDVPSPVKGGVVHDPAAQRGPLSAPLAANGFATLQDPRAQQQEQHLKQQPPQPLRPQQQARTPPSAWSRRHCCSAERAEPERLSADPCSRGT